MYEVASVLEYMDIKTMPKAIATHTDRVAVSLLRDVVVRTELQPALIQKLQVSRLATATLPARALRSQQAVRTRVA